MRPGRIIALLVALSSGCAATQAAGRQSRLAFSGAAGFGVETRGGRGGTVIKVTTLNADGPGSLREALSAKGPRIVVFEVGGVIDLGRKGLGIREPFLTVAGETAPPPGITIIRGGISVTTHDVVIRHMRVRPGDAGRPKRSGWEPDGLSTSGGQAYNVVVDHCSFTWAVDENLSASGPRTEGPDATSHRITFSNCIIAEGLDDSSHSKGRHSKGTLIHDCCTDIAVIGNLYAHNANRNPFFKANTTGVVVNNVIYNPGRRAIQMTYSDREWKGATLRPRNGRISAVGNVMIAGADTRGGLALVTYKGDAYMEDNIALDREGNPAPLHSKSIKLLQAKPSWPDGLRALPAHDVVEHVATNVGARPADRDEIDERIVRQFRESKGRIIDSQEQVGGYPKHEPTRRPLRVPRGDVDGWLAAHAARVEP